MKMRRLLALVLLAAPLPALAATLTWEAAVAEAKAGNADLGAAEESLHQARLQHTIALAQFMPRLSASGGAGQSGDYDPAGGFGQGGATSYSLGLNFSQSLFSGFASLGNLASAKAALAAAEQAARETRARVAYELRSAFSGLLFAQAQVEVNDAIAKRRRDNVNLVELRFEAGREHKGSFLETRALSHQADYEAARAARGRVDAAFSLSRTLGREPDPALAVEGDFQAGAAPTEIDYAREIPRLPGVLKARAAMDAAQASLTQSDAAFHPSLNASAGLSRQGLDLPPASGSWSASLSLSLPLFNGFSDINARRQSTSRLRSAKTELEESRRQGAVDLRQAWSNLADALELAEVRAEFLESAEARSEIARAQYTQGLLGFENWDQIESNLISSRRAALSSRRDAVLAQAAWQRVLGKGLEP